MTDPTDDAIARDGLREAKRALRAAVLARRDAIDVDARRRDSRAIVERLWSHDEIAGARTLLVTLPFGSEWDTQGLVQRALAAGLAVAVPRVDPKARMLELHAVRDLVADVVPGHLGIPEPRPDRPVIAPDAIDAVVVPGVAFDAAGGRLGYGGGYYDRLLPRLRAGVRRIAGAFDVQVVPNVPRGTHDLAVDCVVTPTRRLGACGATS
jgi:5-formyltetrahydrofolate cyclo-ligase